MTVVLSRFAAAVRDLAEENHKYEDGIRRTYWFPNASEEEIRLVHVDQNALESGDAVYPGYFPASPQDGFMYRSAIALIRPEKDNQKLLLPAGWGDWSDATVWNW